MIRHSGNNSVTCPLNSSGSPCGNQCIYDALGKLMTTIPAAGSADFRGPNNEGLIPWQHMAHDVETYDLAKELGKIAHYYTVRPIW